MQFSNVFHSFLAVQEVALICTWHGGKNHSIYTTPSWSVPRALNSMERNPELLDVMEGQVLDSGVKVGGRGSREVSQHVQCSVTETPLHHVSCCWGAAHRLPRSTMTRGSVVVVRVHPHLLNSLILADSQAKADLSSGARGSKVTPPSSVHLDTSPWPWQKPVGAGESEFSVLITRAAVEPGFQDHLSQGAFSVPKSPSLPFLHFYMQFS